MNIKPAWALAPAWTLAQAAFTDFIADKAPTRGAAIAYYTTFSLAPLMLLVVAIAGLVFGQDAAQGALLKEIGGLVGEDGAKTIQALVENARNTGEGIFSTVVSIVLLMMAATTVLAELENALNTIWKAQPPAASGLWMWIKVRLVSLSLIGAVGFLLLVSLVADAGLTAFGTYILGDKATVLLQLLALAVSYIVLTVLFALVYKILPERRLVWHDVWVGAAVTSVLFTLGKYAIGLYIGASHVMSSYGAAGTVVIVLIWVFYSAQIFLLGAEFTKVYALTYGSWKSEAKAPAKLNRDKGKKVVETSRA